MYRLVMCFPCAEKLEDDGEFRLAMFGPQGITLDEESVLITMPVEKCHDPYTTVECDGKCGTTLGVSRSSKWFMDQRDQLSSHIH